MESRAYVIVLWAFFLLKTITSPLTIVVVAIVSARSWPARISILIFFVEDDHISSNNNGSGDRIGLLVTRPLSISQSYFFTSRRQVHGCFYCVASLKGINGLSSPAFPSNTTSTGRPLSFTWSYPLPFLQWSTIAAIFFPVGRYILSVCCYMLLVLNMCYRRTT
jgi:hypothetical protein